MAFKAEILSWRFRHLNIVGCLLKRRPTKGGSRAPQDPLATPLIWSKLKEYNGQFHAVTSLQTDYPAEQANSRKKGITSVSTFPARIILTALHVTHTPGTPGVVVLTKSVLREVAVNQLLHPRIWFLMCDWNIVCFCWLNRCLISALKVWSLILTSNPWHLPHVMCFCLIRNAIVSCESKFCLRWWLRLTQ